MKGKNYRLFESHAFYTPGIGGMLMMLVLMFIGVILGNIASLPLALAGDDIMKEYGFLISYPVMFIPPMIYVAYKGNQNSLFSKGYVLDSPITNIKKGLSLGLLLIIATISSSIIVEPISLILPPMPEWMENLLKSMLMGKFWISFITVCIFAPFFEEWFCRGIVLRGLLHHKNKKGATMPPALAIALSAIFFALIHMNLWQAIPAFLLGLFFGYVYYKTGSLKFTILMHFANNTSSLLMSKIDTAEELQSFYQIIPHPYYIILLIISIITVGWTIMTIKRVPLKSKQGNFKTIENASL